MVHTKHNKTVVHVKMLHTIRMATVRRQTGDFGELMACRFLERKGYTVLERNYLRPWGEIDIIAVKGESVRFVEVKTLSREIPLGVSRESGYRPEEQVHPKKLEKLARTAQLYMDERGDGRDFQIDVVGVYLDRTRRLARCRLYEQVL